MKSYPEAEAALKKAIEMQPLWPAPHTNLANMYLVQGRKKEAIDKFNGAVAANPRDGSAYLSLALLYERDRDYRNAMQVYERALKENPGFWFAANNLAFLISENSDKKEDLARAKTLAEEALRQRPNDPSVLDTLGWIQFRLGDARQAQALIEQALAAAPDADVLNYHLGAVLLRQGQKDEAREKLKKSLQEETAFPGRPEAEKMLKDLR
jgi:tetratricopeptide (TPR) repeat protein